MAEENNNKALELKHNIGDTVQLQFFPAKEEQRYYVKLVGFLHGKSIIVTTPRENGVALRIPVKQDFIVRLVSGNSAKGFSATAIHTTSTPYPHLHLTYPEKLESITVRKAERVDCQLIVSVHNGEQDEDSPEGKSATMNNLSTAGAQLTSTETIADVGENITITCKVTVAEIQQYLNIAGTVRRTDFDSKNNTQVYGVEFNLLEEKDKLLLHAFIYEQLLNITS